MNRIDTDEMSWEIKINCYQCPHLQQSKIDKWARRCEHFKNKNRKCNKKNCPIKL